ncbi:FtsX-like permease family protein [Eubacterium sp.]|uniref:ABC transporter permease n=1 Tax=Eubacterium sp. TaxID=142586 RepID=UPI0025F1B275|nr:FtsX-like permease family protein [Eubacterium sp.]MCR5630120.1 FtsX-like permease family protein [Eubacterium sp.]
MFKRMLLKDIKKGKTINTILCMFIIVATIFVASGINNVVSVLTGLDYFMNKAEIENVMFVTSGPGSMGAADEYLKNEKKIDSYKVENVIYFENTDLINAKTKEECKTRSGNNILQSIDDLKINVFDKNNKKIEKVEKGHTYISAQFVESNDLKVGDKIIVKLEGIEKELIYDGIAKDAFLGASLIGNVRIIVNEDDIKDYKANDKIMNGYSGQCVYIKTDKVKDVKAGISKVSHIAFSTDRDQLKGIYAVDMFAIFIFFILSICLIIISFFILKFSISFTISEEFREIGVMKAIGLKDTPIRKLYITKYTFISIISVSIGLILSVPFGNVIMQTLSNKMYLGNEFGITLNVIGSILVCIVVIGFAYFCTKRIKKLTPIDAIRSGMTGERYKKKNKIKLSKSKAKTSMFMAANDVLDSPKKYFNIFISTTICILFMLIMVNAYSTLNSSAFLDMFGAKADIYIDNMPGISKQMYNVEGKKGFENFLNNIKEDLKKEGINSRVGFDMNYKLKTEIDGKEYLLTYSQGINTVQSDYKFSKGSAPENENEIAISGKLADEYNVGIGDTIKIDTGKGFKDYIITAKFRTMNLMGELLRFNEKTEIDYSYVAGGMQIAVFLEGDHTASEIEEVKDKIKALYPKAKVLNQKEYCVDCLAVVDAVKVVQYVLLIVTIFVVVLLIIMMEKTFVYKEKNDIALLKAIGFKDSFVRNWHTNRFIIVTILAMITAIVLSVPLTKLFITPIFGMLGTSDIKYRYDIGGFVLYPVIVLLATIVAANISVVSTRKIVARDTANIE